MLREEFLVPLGFSANALAIALRVPSTRISKIVPEHQRRYGVSVGEIFWDAGTVLDELAE